MHIVFIARTFSNFRNYEGVIERLASRGHTLELTAAKTDDLGGEALVERLSGALPGVSIGSAPDRESDPWSFVRSRVRLAFDYLRYLEPQYDEAEPMRVRRRTRAPAGMVRFTESWFGRSRFGRGCARFLLRQAEKAFPVDREVEEWLASRRPDFVLLTPLLELGSSQFDFLVSARRLGYRTAFCVWSWDNLTGKALIRDLPDLVMVWNDVQRSEAIRYHGVPKDRIVVTGAQNFDPWFNRRPARSRADFCRRVGLPDGRPFLLWVCSALIHAAPEAPIVRRWIESIRSSTDPALRSAAILVRPHPSRLREWQGDPLADLSDVAVWGTNPIDPDSRADYFDSLYHSALVTGINTSAFLEAAIVGRPVHTLILDEFFEHQEGTLHFHYLRTVEGGLLRAARTMEEHLAQLGASLASPASVVAQNERFVRAFIRPHGLNVEATDAFVRAIEERATLPAAPRDRSWTPGLLRPALARIVRRAEQGDLLPWLLSERELQGWVKRNRRNVERREKKAEERARALSRRRQAEAERQARKIAKAEAILQKRRKVDAERRAREVPEGRS